MMKEKMFEKPKVGSFVTVTTDFTDYFAPFCRGIPRLNVKSGQVVGSKSYDDPHSFRIATGSSYHPVSVIPLENVTKLTYADGSAGSQREKKKIEVLSWTVKSDSRKGGSYTVVREGNRFSCDCAGFMFRKNCRHVIKIKAEVA